MSKPSSRSISNQRDTANGSHDIGSKSTRRSVSYNGYLFSASKSFETLVYGNFLTEEDTRTRIHPRKVSAFKSSFTVTRVSIPG